ncbi:MAG: hypothetical protein HRT68_12225 [Flavobacteriaceae bacterium]|nr:hypothetical protein [Flavobacteriaceae bacterium]
MNKYIIFLFVIITSFTTALSQNNTFDIKGKWELEGTQGYKLIIEFAESGMVTILMGKQRIHGGEYMNSEGIACKSLYKNDYPENQNFLDFIEVNIETNEVIKTERLLYYFLDKNKFKLCGSFEGEIRPESCGNMTPMIFIRSSE